MAGSFVCGVCGGGEGDSCRPYPLYEVSQGSTNADPRLFFASLSCLD